MRAWDHADDELYLKSRGAKDILSDAISDVADLLDIFPRDTLLYFLRIALIICGYVVVRPLIEASFRRVMTPPKQTINHLEKARQKSLADELLVDTGTAADDEVDGSVESHNDQSHRKSTGKAEWGGTLRHRQKAKFLEAWEEEQARLAEEEELRELEDILED